MQQLTTFLIRYCIMHQTATVKTREKKSDNANGAISFKLLAFVWIVQSYKLFQAN